MARKWMAARSRSTKRRTSREPAAAADIPVASMRTDSRAMLRRHLHLEDGPELAPRLGPSNLRILIVNEDMRSADSLKRTLFELGYFTTFTAYSAKRALAAALEFSPAVALLDLELPDMTGYQLAGKF